MLQAEGLETYYGNIKALKGVDLEVSAGSIVTILGVNGAGKTTLLKTITGLLKPKAGTILFLREDITRLKPHQIVKKGIALVPEGRAILSKMTVLENLEMGAFHRTDGGIKDDIEKETSHFPWLKERKGQPGGSLSGGEQQMLAISRALLSHPKLLLLDEPSLGLAPLVVSEIFRILQSDQPGGDHGPPGGAERQTGLEGLPVRLRAGNRENRPEGETQELLENPKIKESFLGQKA